MSVADIMSSGTEYVIPEEFRECVEESKWPYDKYDYDSRMYDYENVFGYGKNELHYKDDSNLQPVKPIGLKRCDCMFYCCKLPESFSLEKFDFSGISGFNHMFHACTFSDNGKLYLNWDYGPTSNEWMFYHCKLPKDGLIISNFIYEKIKNDPSYLNVFEGSNILDITVRDENGNILDIADRFLAHQEAKKEKERKRKAEHRAWEKEHIATKKEIEDEIAERCAILGIEKQTLDSHYMPHDAHGLHFYGCFARDYGHDIYCLYVQDRKDFWEKEKDELRKTKRVPMLRVLDSYKREIGNYHLFTAKLVYDEKGCLDFVKEDENFFRFMQFRDTGYCTIDGEIYP